MKFVLFKKSLEEGAAPIYLFEGEEEYFKKRGEEMLREKFVAEPSLDASAFEGADLKGGNMTALVAAAESFPFISAKRLVKVTDFFPTDKEYAAWLKPYFENPQPSTILLIVNSAKPKGKTADLKKMPNVTYVDCSRADEETVMRWIFTQFKRAGVSADTEVCERVMRYCLADMSRVAGETEKLIAYAGKGGALTSADVDEIVYRDTDYKIYEMTAAVSAGNYTKYAEVLAELRAKGADEMNVLNGLAAYFRSLFEISSLKKSDAETAVVLGMKEYAVKMSRRQASAFTAAQLRECWQMLYGAVADVKSGRLTPEGALLRANANIFFALRTNNGA